MFFYEYTEGRLEDGIGLINMSSTAGIPWYPKPIVVRLRDFPDARPGDVLNEGFILFSPDARSNNSFVTDRMTAPFRTVILWLHPGDAYQIQSSQRYLGDRKFDHCTNPRGELCGIERFAEGDVSEVTLLGRADGAISKHWIACYRNTDGDLLLVHLEDFDQLKLHLERIWRPSKNADEVVKVIKLAEQRHDKQLADFLRSIENQ